MTVIYALMVAATLACVVGVVRNEQRIKARRAEREVLYWAALRHPDPESRALASEAYEASLRGLL